MRPSRPLAPSGTITPANLPFGLRIAPTSTGSPLASLTNEDGVTLGIGAQSINGTPVASVAGLVASDTITYTGVVPISVGTSSSGADLAVRATTVGVDARIVLPGPTTNGSFVFTVTPDARAQLIQDTDGIIRVTRPITVYTDDGRPYPVPQPEYLIGPATAIDGNPDPASAVTPAPVTLALAPGTSAAAQTVTLTIDSSWLHDPRRIFPIRLDLPIVTAPSGVDTGIFGTVNSCAPTVLAPRTQVIVGTEGACTYHGQAFFDVSSLPPNTSIQSATLHLYTPDQIGATGVQVYQNASANPQGPLAPWDQPSWNTASPIVTGSIGIAQSASNGHWQTWDVTSLVRQWAQSRNTNAGMTLVGTGSPVLFAWPLGANSGDPSVSPYLDITYATAASPAAAIDGAQDIYGISGTFANTCSGGAIVCGQSIAVDQVKALNGSYIRISVLLSCASRTPGTQWWNSNSNADLNNVGFINQILQRANTDNLIPIVNFVPNTTHDCSPTPVPMDATTWNQETQDFVKYEIGSGLPYPTSKMIYFEIGNEPNTKNFQQYGGSAQAFGTIFGNAATGLKAALVTRLSDSNFRVLTGGMAQPTTAIDNIHLQCYDPWGRVNVLDALYAASNAIQMGVSPSNVGLGAHPYSYNTAESNYWLNYYTLPPGPSGEHNHFYGICGDISTMIPLWTQGNSPPLPLIFTEDNWSAQPLGEQDCSDP